MEQLIEKFVKARENLLEIVDSFPKKRTDEILFDKWSLKNIRTHLEGKARYEIKTLKQFEMGIVSEDPPNLKESINENLVSERVSWSWNRVYGAFLKTSQDLIDEYKRLPVELWKKKIWDNKKITPREFIQFEIIHYENTHGPQIKKVLEDIL